MPPPLEAAAGGRRRGRPVGGHASWSRCRGVVGKALDEDFGLVVGREACHAKGPAEGPPFLFEPSLSAFCSQDRPDGMLQFIDDCLSSPVVDSSGPGGCGLALLSLTAHDTTHQLESTEPAVVFDNDDHCGEQAWPSVQSIIATFKKPLVQPILPSTPTCARPRRLGWRRMMTRSLSGVPALQPRASSVTTSWRRRPER